MHAQIDKAVHAYAHVMLAARCECVVLMVYGMQMQHGAHCTTALLSRKSIEHIKARYQNPRFMHVLVVTVKECCTTCEMWAAQPVRGPLNGTMHTT